MVTLDVGGDQVCLGSDLGGQWGLDRVRSRKWVGEGWVGGG